MRIQFTDRLYATLLITLVGLGLLDAFASALWVNHHFASEANPLMAALMNIDLSLFLYVKIAVTTLCGFFLWRLRRQRLARYALILALVVYLYVFYKHCAIAYQVFTFYKAVNLITHGSCINLYF